MPISFDTLSHGEIPIGFFNIESDMFLIHNHFIFANDLCSAITEWTKGTENISTELKMYIISDQNDIGNLMGAINGITFTGFIGELYQLYPFPEKNEDFKQNPEGYRTRKKVEEIIIKYSKQVPVAIEIRKEDQTISIGEFKFNKEQFHEVIAYIWRGGMPRWRDEERVQ